MEKTRDLFKKIRDTKGTFHPKMGTIRDRNGMDLTEAEDMARIHRVSWHKYSQFSSVAQLCPTLCDLIRRTVQKKIFMTQITMMV